MITINNLTIEEKINNLFKAVEIVGGKDLISNNFSDKEELSEFILSSVLENGSVAFKIGNENFSLGNLLDVKVDYEKYFLKNKNKVAETILYKIKKYDNSLDSKIRKYKKSRDMKEYLEIKELLLKTYRRDINSFILKAIDDKRLINATREDEELLYGEYLSEKRKTFIDGLIRKMGMD